MSYNQEVIYLIISMSYIGVEGDIPDKVATGLGLIKIVVFTIWAWVFMLRNYELLGRDYPEIPKVYKHQKEGEKDSSPALFEGGEA